MNTDNIYERFFRDGGYRLMRLMVTKAYLQPEADMRVFNVAALMRLQHGLEDDKEYARRMARHQQTRVYEICRLDEHMQDLLRRLPWGWGEVIERIYGKGEKTGSKHSGIRKSRAENALAGAIEIINEDQDFASEGVAVVGKLMSYIERASYTGEDISQSLLMKAVTSMKLFRESQQAIIYTDALDEFCEKTGRMAGNYMGDGGDDMIISDMLIRSEVRDCEQFSGLEHKICETSSSTLIERMYDLYGIMYAIQEYLPDKYERIMSFHWTKSCEKLTELFTEVAAMIAAVDEELPKKGLDSKIYL